MVRKLGVALVIFMAICGFVLPSFAGSLVPEGVQVFEYAGRDCILWPDGSGECYCPCEVCVNAENRESSTNVHSETNTAGPAWSSTPGPTNTLVPTAKPPEPTEKPKQHCDQGRGNGDDGCSPGNSDNQHGPNDGQKGPRK